MVRIPSLSRRTAPAPDDTGRTDEAATTHDGATDRADDTTRTSRPVVTDRTDEQTTYRSTAGPAEGREADAARRAAVARAATARSDEGTRRTPVADPAQERTLDGRTVDPDRDAAAARVDRDRDGVPDRAERPVVAGPKPRSSLLATLGLIAGVAGVLFVLTGTLAGYGIGLGAVGAVLAVLGLAATRRRHVAGTTDALLGIVAGLGAVVLGVLAMTGQFDWPTTDGDWVARFREWLDSQFVDRF
ncbi:thrombospondin [Micromonospora sp. WMMC415]|uniref:thrombospondin n=1 Tax=Micromonospora sp. WMMC415 TaxID=2675222 RepID=UPI0012B4D84B|nr:thrombospondin [Micromonospora sp. WMMC415]QGN47070.1 thrombospondin [Micromonospora sp. WMMC415]